MKRNYFIIIFSVIVTMLLASCGDGKSETEKLAAAEKAADSLALKIAVLPTLDCLPVYVAKELSLFDKQDIDVRLKMYSAHMDCDTALTTGAVDGTFTDIVRVENLKARGVDCDVRNVTNISWQLVTNKMARINRLNQLENKMIAMTRFSATHLLAGTAMQKGKLTDDKTFLVQINDVNLRLLMLRNNEMDALLLPEPQATLARLEGHKVLLDSRKLGMQLGALAFNNVKDSTKKQQIDKFIEVYEQACDTINKYGFKKYRKLISDFCGIDESLVDSIPQDISFVKGKNVRKEDAELATQWYKKNR